MLEAKQSFMRLDLDAGWAKGLGPLKNEEKTFDIKKTGLKY